MTRVQELRWRRAIASVPMSPGAPDAIEAKADEPTGWEVYLR